MSAPALPTTSGNYLTLLLRLDDVALQGSRRRERPAIARARLADRIDLAPGLNVMDVSGYATPMQMLFVQGYAQGR